MDLCIEFNQSIELKFQVFDTPIAQLWAERMANRAHWELDDSTRFYGFGTQEEEEHVALEKINHCIKLIKQCHPNILIGFVDNVRDQDKLNQWHHVFEVYHGLLGREDRNNDMTPVLADLNIAVHRCESVARGNRPRFVCTWYGMTKTQTLPVELMREYGTLNPSFGSVCLNYCEIGKTLEDLVQDDDKYIADEAFKPFSYYSADFNVRFYEETKEHTSKKLVQMQEYYNKFKDFFHSQGLTSFKDPRLLPLRFPVADLVETMPREDLIKQISLNQIITKVTLE